MIINFKNTTENLIITIAVMLTVGFITYRVTISSALEANKQTIEALRPSLIEAIKKETTAIKNDINVDVDKIKKSDSINININQIPENKLHQVVKKAELVPPGYTLIKIENLTSRQKRRLGL